MKIKPLSSALAVIFGAGSFLGGSVVASADELTGSLTVTGSAGSVQTSPGPSFSYSTEQAFAINLGNPYNGQLVGDLSQGIMSAQAVTGSFLGTPGDGIATATYSTTITNTGSTAQAYNFNFYIGSATLISMPLFNYYAGAGTLTSTIDASIDVNGQSAWSYDATLTGSSAGTIQGQGEVFSLSTSALGPTYTETPIQDGFGQYVTFDPYTGSLALGTLAPGASEDLTYTLSGTTSSQIVPNSLAYYGGSLAQIGDPFSVEGQHVTFQVVPASPVPEPSSTVLTAAGLALLAGLTRRRRTLAGV